MKKYVALFLFAAVFLLVEFPVSAAEAGTAGKAEEAADALLREFGLEDVTDALEELMPGERIDFPETVRQIIGGRLPFSWETAERLIKSQWMYQFGYHRESLVRILLLAVLAAVFANFSGIFPNQKIADVSFYVLYLLLLTVCLNGFRAMSDLAGGQLGRLTGFMKVLGPVYFLAVAMAGRGGTSTAFYHLVLVLILLVELVIVKLVLPLIHVYMMVEVLNHLSEEDYLSKTAELVRLSVGWILKTMLACVVGFNVIQGLLMPVIDSVKQGALARTAEAIPGIGDAVGGMAEVLLGTAVLVKNGIGIAGAAVCIGICAVPLLQVGFLMFLYKLIAALIEPVSDRRIVSCIAGMGNGYELLARAVFTSGVLFLLTIGIAAAVTT